MEVSAVQRVVLAIWVLLYRILMKSTHDTEGFKVISWIGISRRAISFLHSKEVVEFSLFIPDLAFCTFLMIPG
jgi:hypothetical protein